MSSLSILSHFRYFLGKNCNNYNDYDGRHTWQLKCSNSMHFHIHYYIINIPWRMMPGQSIQGQRQGLASRSINQRCKKRFYVFYLCHVFYVFYFNNFFIGAIFYILHIFFHLIL